MNKTPKQLAETFIRLAKEETGCSDEFLDKAKDSIVNLYRDVKGEALEVCLMDIKGIIKSQAETEQIWTETKKDLKKLAETEEILQSSLANLKKSSSELRDNWKVLQACRMSSYGDA